MEETHRLDGPERAAEDQSRGESLRSMCAYPTNSISGKKYPISNFAVSSASEP